tara:strand:- start:283 stop:1332 length:1050 start_codon:yes stop_codon:yes gene_type:complete
MALTTNPTVWKILLVMLTLITIFFGVFFFFIDIFITFVIALCLIIITEKLMNNYKRHMHKYSLSKFMSKLVAFFLILFWVSAIVFLFANSIEELASSIANSNEANINSFYQNKIKPLIPNAIHNRFRSDAFIENSSKYLLSLLSTALSKISKLVLNGILIIPLMFYLYFRRKEEIKSRLDALVPLKYHQAYRRAMFGIAKQLHDFFAAKVIESVIIGAICCLGFFVAGVKGWLILGILAGIFNIIPYIGPIVGAIPPILVSLLDQPIVAFYVIITIFIAQLIDNLYLIPFMVSSKVKVDALFSIVLILVGSQLLGVLGMLLAIPIYLVYKIILTESYKELVRIENRKDS